MNIKKKLGFLKKNDYILYLWNLNRIRKQNKSKRKYTDLELVNKLYLETTGRELDLEKPTRYTEKLQWMKLFYRDKNMEKCADKYLVRDYVQEKGYGHLLNEVLGVWDDVSEMNIKELPERFVLKATHGSGMNLIVTNKDDVNWFIWKKIMKLWLKQNIYFGGREWVYKDLKPQIICEKYMEDNSGELKDYKFFCSSGEILFIQVDSNRFTKHHQTFYDPEWKIYPFTTGESPSKEDKPKNFNEMLEIVKVLCEDFPIVRVDLYNVNGKIYFGELTFFGNNGFFNFEPDQYDFHWGSKVNLPQENHRPEN